MVHGLGSCRLIGMLIGTPYQKSTTKALRKRSGPSYTSDEITVRIVYDPQDYWVCLENSDPIKNKSGRRCLTVAKSIATSPTQREDYALRRVPAAEQRRSSSVIFNVAIGVGTALFFLADGGELASTYGVKEMFLGMLCGVLLIGAIGFLIIKLALRTGLSSDLVTRASGYGFMGSSISSFVYTFNFIMFAAFEGSILASAVNTAIPVLPMTVDYLLVGAIFIPLCWYGISLMDRIGRYTLPIYIVLLGIVVVEALMKPGSIGQWWSSHPVVFTLAAAGPAWLQVFSTNVSLVSVGTNTADIARFVKNKAGDDGDGKRVLHALALSFGVIAITLLVLVPLGSLLAFKFHQSNPGVYIPHTIGILGLLFVLITQIRINVMNIYGGSLAYSNFFARVFHFTPGRHWWVIVTVAISTGLMIGGIYTHLLQLLTFEGMFIIAWSSTVASDILINRGLLHLSTSGFEYRRAMLRDWNPVGVVPIIVALVVAIPLSLGVAGPLWVTLTPFLAGAIGFGLPPIVALITRGRTYMAEITAEPVTVKGEVNCVTCGGTYINDDDMVQCPFHKGPICPVCCAADSHCHALCKKVGTGSLQITERPSLAHD